MFIKEEGGKPFWILLIMMLIEFFNFVIFYSKHQSLKLSKIKTIKVMIIVFNVFFKINKHQDKIEYV